MHIFNVVVSYSGAPGKNALIKATEQKIIQSDLVNANLVGKTNNSVLNMP